jgi:hypothetical protein
MQARHEAMRAGQLLRGAAGYESMTSARAMTLYFGSACQPGYAGGKMKVATEPGIHRRLLVANAALSGRRPISYQ